MKYINGWLVGLSLFVVVSCSLASPPVLDDDLSFRQAMESLVAVLPKDKKVAVTTEVNGVTYAEGGTYWPTKIEQFLSAYEVRLTPRVMLKNVIIDTRFFSGTDKDQEKVALSKVAADILLVPSFYQRAASEQIPVAHKEYFVRVVSLDTYQHQTYGWIALNGAKQPVALKASLNKQVPACYQEGEMLRVNVTLPETGYLAILGINDDGRAVQYIPRAGGTQRMSQKMVDAMWDESELMTGLAPNHHQHHEQMIAVWSKIPLPFNLAVPEGDLLLGDQAGSLSRVLRILQQHPDAQRVDLFYEVNAVCP